MDKTRVLPDQVFRDPAERAAECWRATFAGRIEPATFNSKGAALAYLDILRSGRRKPEWRPAEEATP